MFLYECILTVESTKQLFRRSPTFSVSVYCQQHLCNISDAWQPHCDAEIQSRKLLFTRKKLQQVTKLTDSELYTDT